MTETEKIIERYEKRKFLAETFLYNKLTTYVYLTQQEKERKLIKLFNNHNLIPISDKKLLEIGCGTGSNLLELILMGFDPGNLVGNELLEDRLNAVRYRLPEATKIMPGDAAELDLESNSFDIVYQSTVFTSLLDDEFQQKLAKHMWSLAKNGTGGVLWYDFIYNNPKNPDVRGVSLKRIKELFPKGEITYYKITLAPPIGRFVTKIHPCFYHIFNVFPFLRTHILAWIAKKE